MSASRPELLVLSASSREALLRAVDARLSGDDAAEEGRAGEGLTVALVARDAKDAAAKLAKARAAVANGTRLEDPTGVYFEPEPLGASRIAFVFPGQGSEWSGMLAGARACFTGFEENLVAFDRMARSVSGASVRAFAFPSGAPGERAAKGGTHEAQLSLALAEAALVATLEAWGVTAQQAAGHSFGELVALFSQGAFDAEALFEASDARGKLLAEAGTAAPGGMIAVRASATAVHGLLDGLPGLTLANHNAPEQVVVAGGHEALAAFEARCREAGALATRLRVACAFHSPAMAPVETRWRAFLRRLVDRGALRGPSGVVVANASAEVYPKSAEGAATLLGRQVTASVRWVEVVEKLYANGARIFVEVGPSRVLTGTVGRILAGRPHVAVPLDDRTDDGGSPVVLHALARLAAHGAPVRVPGRPKPADRPRAHRPPERRPPEHRPPAPFDARPAVPVAVPGDVSSHVSLQPSVTAMTLTSSDSMLAAFFDSNASTMSGFLRVVEGVLRAAEERLSPEQRADLLARLLEVSARVTGTYLGVHERAVSPSAAAAPATATAPVLPAAAVPPAVHAPAPPSRPRLEADDGRVVFLPPPSSRGSRERPARAAADDADLGSWLRRLVAQATGFTFDAVTLDKPFDDLGVDSLTFATLLGEVGKKRPAARAQAAALYKARSLADVVRILESTDTLTRPAAAVAPAAAPAPSPAATSPSVTGEIATLHARLAERLAEGGKAPSGAAPSEVPLSAAFEADLGLDAFELERLFEDVVPERLRASCGRELFACSTLGEALELLKGFAREAEPALEIAS